MSDILNPSAATAAAETGSAEESKFTSPKTVESPPTSLQSATGNPALPQPHELDEEGTLREKPLAETPQPQHAPLVQPSREEEEERALKHGQIAMGTVPPPAVQQSIPPASEPAAITTFALNQPRPVSGMSGTVPRTSQYMMGESEALKNQRSNHQFAFGLGVTCIRAGEMVNFSGPAIVPETVLLSILFRDAVLDFSRAQFVHAITYVYIFSLGSGIRLTIPRGVRVESSGFGICGDFGGMQSGVDANNPETDAPIIRMMGVCLCAGTTIELNYQVPELIIHREAAAAAQHQVQNV